MERAVFHSSPKRRCRQTIEPLAKALGAKIETQPVLDEGADPELVARWVIKQTSDILCICSHGDILPDLGRVLLGGRLRLNFKKSTVAMIRLGEGETPELLHLVLKPGGAL
jgi:phosphohistidine phosphatase SixA